MEIVTRNTNTLARFIYSLFAIPNHRVKRALSRNGPVLMIDEPVSVCLTHPWERLNFTPGRDANPFFHLIEAMAMLANVNDVELMSHFASSMRAFSDDGQTYNAFYGTRARGTWGDQINDAIHELTERPQSRQVVVQLWDPRDLTRSSKDKACNLCLLFSISGGKLKMTSYNRSNDAILGGISGANVVHLPFFQEYVANALKLPVGDWWHVSNNLHLYLGQPKWKEMEKQVTRLENPYATYQWTLPRLMYDKVCFDADLGYLLKKMQVAVREQSFLQEADIKKCFEPFLLHVVVPVFQAWQTRKLVGTKEALDATGAIAAPDWKFACNYWLLNRLATP